MVPACEGWDHVVGYKGLGGGIRGAVPGPEELASSRPRHSGLQVLQGDAAVAAGIDGARTVIAQYEDVAGRHGDRTKVGAVDAAVVNARLRLRRSVHHQD